MIHKSDPVAYWRRVNDALVEAGDPPLASSEAYDLYKSGLSSEDALILSFSVPNNLRLGIRARLSTGRLGQRDRLIQFRRVESNNSRPIGSSFRLMSDAAAPENRSDERLAHR
jgi:hypothetical protein